jgi:hypothetical protein
VPTDHWDDALEFRSKLEFLSTFEAWNGIISRAKNPSPHAQQGKGKVVPALN